MVRTSASRGWSARDRGPAFSDWQAVGDGSAERTEARTGVREVVEFFGGDEGRMFGARHRPAAGSGTGVVVCPGLQAEFLRDYRREVMLARSLAMQGVCVQRFHYRGTGNSDGDSSGTTFASMVEDAVRSAEWMLSNEGCEHVAVVGVRLGGLVAAAASNLLEHAPVVLWEPFTGSRAYFRDVFRAGRIHELRKGGTGRSTATQLEELDREGRLDILGYSIDRSLYGSLQDRALVDELGDRPRPVLLVGISPRGVLRNADAGSVAELQARGFPVETRVMSMPEEPWWFVGGRSFDDEARLTSEIVRVTTEWITRLWAGDRVDT